SLCGVSLWELSTCQSFFSFLLQVKPQFERRADINCRVFTAIVYRTQVVAGTMYFIKVQVSDANYVHLKVFQSLPHENQGPSLADFQTGKTRDDPLTYF
uniref:Cystatin domain-containing protein n=1 Tax=Cyanoderma ruficeps TaxID=181631 RepID=A0A8C3XEG4_9PASS